MIDRNELLAIANATGLTGPVVEKDYILGWLMRGISTHAEFRERWLFKGGTCLKKCYFETYRFSEDLDFTLLRAEHVNGGWPMRVAAYTEPSLFWERSRGLARSWNVMSDGTCLASLEDRGSDVTRLAVAAVH